MTSLTCCVRVRRPNSMAGFCTEFDEYPFIHSLPSLSDA